MHEPLVIETVHIVLILVKSVEIIRKKIVFHNFVIHRV